MLALPAGRMPLPPQHRAGSQQLPPRYQMPQDLRSQGPSAQYRLQQPYAQQQALHRQRMLQQSMAPNEAMQFHPSLQQQVVHCPLGRFCI